MSIRKLKENIFSVGVNHWDRRLFDELIPLPDGTSYNSYLIFGDKQTILIDTVDPAVKDELFRNLSQFERLKIDFVISLHSEQDHSGSIPFVLERFPEAKVITNEKCKELLMEHLSIPQDKFVLVKDGETFDIGGKTLQFIFTPWVHWPETMSAYLKEDEILFSCDFFGSHLAISTLYEKSKSKLEESAKRYFAEIMAPFRSFVRANLKKLDVIEIKLIAPSHGPIHDEPKFIIDLYRNWSSDEVKNEVLLLYVSMHGSTKILADALINSIIDKGITVHPFNMINADLGEIAIKSVDAATIILMTPTVLTGPHPVAAYYTIFLNAIKPKAMHFVVVTSYGWGGIAPDWIKSHMSNFKGEFLDPVQVKGLPKNLDILRMKELAEKVLDKHKTLGIV